MVSSDETTDDEMRAWRRRVEELIARAVEEGAEVNFALLRFEMDMDKRYGFSRPDPTVIGYLEERIATAIREREKRASRRSFIVRFKNLIGLG